MTDSVSRMRLFLSTFRAMDDATLDLMMLCVGRVFLNFPSPSDALAPSNNPGVDHYYIEDIVHVADWLIVSVQQNVRWLRNVDDKGRPKKLMKFSNFSAIVREANKQMMRFQKSELRSDLGHDDEKVAYQLENGWYIVQLLSPSSLDHESKEMQHCIGHGAYDASLLDGSNQYYSLRDQHGKAHATLEVFDGKVLQFQGKQNKQPISAYVKSTIPFLQSFNLECNKASIITDLEGVLHHISALPDVLKVGGNLLLDNTTGQKLKLPRVMEVGGDLTIRGYEFSNVPDSITTGRNFSVYEGALIGLPHRLSVGRAMSYEGRNAIQLPDDFTIKHNLYLTGVNLDKLPKNLYVSGLLDISNTKIAHLPSCLKVGSIYISDTKISEFNTEVFHNSKYARLIALDSQLSQIVGTPVFDELRISSNKLERLPENLEVNRLVLENMNGVTISSDASIKSLMVTDCTCSIDSGEFVGDVGFKNSKIVGFPSIKCGGRLIINATEFSARLKSVESLSITLVNLKPESVPDRLFASESIDFGSSNLERIECNVDAPVITIPHKTSYLGPDFQKCSLNLGSNYIFRRTISWNEAQKFMKRDGNLEKWWAETWNQKSVSNVATYPRPKRTWTSEDTGIVGDSQMIREADVPLLSRVLGGLDQLQ